MTLEVLETTYGTSVASPCTDSNGASLLQLCQSHTACSSIILTLGGAVRPAAGRHAAPATGQLLQLAGEGHDLLFVFPHLKAEMYSPLKYRGDIWQKFANPVLFLQNMTLFSNCSLSLKIKELK